MKYINTIQVGDRIKSVYLVNSKIIATARNSKEFASVMLMDKTGSIDSKIWELGAPGICEFEVGDYVEAVGQVIEYNKKKQFKIDSIRVASPSEYDEADYVPVTEFNIDDMYAELLGFIDTISNDSIKKLLKLFFVEDETFVAKFKVHTAAKSVHHGFRGGLLEHTLGVTRICNFIANTYPFIKKDILVSTAMLHDIGKIYELSSLPENEYTDSGNLLGHIIMGTMMVRDKIKLIPGFSTALATEMEHCILAHHGKLEYGSPKVPATVEAYALHLADNYDAKMESFKELFKNNEGDIMWLGFNKNLDTNVKKSIEI